MAVDNYTLSAAVGGLNLRDPLDQLPQEDALILDNFFPDVGRVSLRGGSQKFCSLGTSKAVEALTELTLATGEKKAIAASDKKLFEWSSGTAANITGTTVPTSNNWQTHQFRNRIFLCNGADTPQRYDGSGVCIDVAVTGVTPSTLVNVSSFKRSLYFVQRDSASFWYLPANALSGALTEFSLSNIFNKGGYLLFAGQHTNQTATSSQSLFMAVSSEGEVLLYNGTDPTDFSLVSRYEIGRPQGYSAFVLAENDSLIITDGGIVPTTSLLTQSSSLAANSLSRKINPAISLGAKQSSGIRGWNGVYWPQGRRILINMPMSGADSVQYPMNTETGSWGKFIYGGSKPRCWCVLDGQLYYGDNEGEIIRAESGRMDRGSSSTGSPEVGLPIQVDYLSAWNFFGSRGSFKVFRDARPIFRGTAIGNLQMNMNTNFQEARRAGSLPSVGTTHTPWGSSWGSPWAGATKIFYQRYGLSGQGHCGAVRLWGSLSNVALDLLAIEIGFESGGRV